MLWRYLAPSLAAIALLAGCGGGDEDKSKQPSAQAERPALENLARRLYGAGYTVDRQRGEPGVDDRLVINEGPLKVTFRAYQSNEAADDGVDDLREQVDDDPSRVGMLRQGRFVVTGKAAPPTRLPVDKLAKLADYGIEPGADQVSDLKEQVADAIEEERRKKEEEQKKNDDDDFDFPPDFGGDDDDDGPLRVPDVVGENHQDAQDILEDAGFDRLFEEDCTGDGRPIIFDFNWVVEKQEPQAGAVADVDTPVTLCSRKYDD